MSEKLIITDDKKSFETLLGEEIHHWKRLKSTLLTEQLHIENKIMDLEHQYQKITGRRY